MDDNAMLITVIRSLGASWRALLLYPPGSPMTLEVATSACSAVEEFLQAEPSLRLDVVREGFVLRGLDGVLVAPGVADLADGLASHGIGEVHFNAPPAPDELLALLGAVQTQPHELHAQGGVAKALQAANVSAIKVVSVQLQKVEAPPEIPEDEAEQFLQQLAGDPDRLALWLASLLSADDEGLTEGILVLAEAAVDARVFGRTLALAFQELDADDKDRMLESAIHLQPLRDILGEMVANLSAVELTAAIRGGRYGANMLSISFALAGLPLGSRASEVQAEAELALTSADATEADIEFLRRMLERRRDGSAEQPLAASQPYYAAAAAAVALTPEQISAGGASYARHMHIEPQGAAVMLHLLDTAQDHSSYASVLRALANTVPKLFEAGAAALALRIISEVMRRSASTERAWPGLDVEYLAAVDIMCGLRTMKALLNAHSADPSVVEVVRQLVSLCGETPGNQLAAASIEPDWEGGFGLAEEVLGRRLAEMLAPVAQEVDATRASRLAELFARDGGPRCMQALNTMLARTEDKVRIETARGLGTAGGEPFYALMPRLLRDDSMSVAAFAARTLSHHADPRIIAMLTARLDELEGDGDLLLGREIIGVLSASGQEIALEALKRTAEKGGRLRKGRYADLRKLASDAVNTMMTGSEGTV